MSAHQGITHSARMTLLACLVLALHTTIVSGAADDKPKNIDAPDQIKTLKLRFVSEFAIDLAEFLRKYVDADLEIQVRRITPRDAPKAVSQLTITGESETVIAIDKFSHVCLKPASTAINDMRQANLDDFLRAMGRSPVAAPEPRPSPKPVKRTYQLTPKKARALESLLHKHGKLTMKLKVKVGKMEIEALPSTFELMIPVLEELGAEELAPTK